jgi:hypothetical protein
MSSQSCHDLLASNALDKPADIGMQMWRSSGRMMNPNIHLHLQTSLNIT